MSGGTGGADATGSAMPMLDSSVPVEPPPAPGELPATIRILPLGDSLTFGTSDDFTGFLANLDGGYRVLLRELLVDDGYTIDYVGTQLNGPADFDREHEGHPGATIEVIGEHWADAQGQIDPHIVLLLAGTNDQLGVTGDQPPGPASEALGGLIDQIDSDHPGVRIVVAKPVLLGMGILVGAENIPRMKEYADLVPGIVEGRRTAGLNVHLADLSSVDTTLFGDGVHPTAWEGYEAMARLWHPTVVEAIEALRE